MAAFTVRPDDPMAPDVQALLATHLAFGAAHSPPEDVHALPATMLVSPAIDFFSVRDDGQLLGIRALKRLTDDHAEIKSMHTAASARGRGVARAMLTHLIDLARSRGLARISLETGSMEAFAPARALYVSAGFQPCGPFADYPLSDYSSHMTPALR